ncbi:MAG: septal ring lytic transglycosylase RlpA family protein [Desulfovibrionaceae bacterium]|nr:septal ring lytic transglycosylase RlpA family protein [Desulfovibrionaceae bacterium]
MKTPRKFRCLAPAVALALLAVAALTLEGCAPKSISGARQQGSSQQQGGGGTGKPYTVRGKTYRPYTTAHGFTEVGVASWYGPGFHGKKTSNGEIYNQNAMTAAHKLLPFNTSIRVTNLDNGRSTVVRINDRGPFVDNRIIDLSRRAAQELDMIGPGTARVRLEATDSKKPILTADGDMLGRFYVQIGAFGVAANAQKQLSAIKKQGLNGRILRSATSALSYVQVGPFPSIDRAEDMLTRLRGAYPGLFVVAE